MHTVDPPTTEAARSLSSELNDFTTGSAGGSQNAVRISSLVPLGEGTTPITVNGHVYSMHGQVSSALNGQYITPDLIGEETTPVTVNGHVYSKSYQTSFILSGQTIRLDNPEPTAHSLTAVDTIASLNFDIGNRTFTALDSDGLGIDGITITAGCPAATVNGTKISLRSGGTLVVGNESLLLGPSHTPFVGQGGDAFQG